MHWSLLRCLLVLFLMACGATGCAQVRTVAPVRALPPDLNEMTRRARMIFVGKVLRVEPVRVASSDEVASVQITFQVEQGMRGARNGQTVAFREWAGLWTRGARYRVGQRLMLFLYAPSALGLTSPVGGRAGEFAVDHTGQIALTPAQQQAIRVSPKPVHINVNRPVPVRDFARVIRRMREE
ncbi:MAG TPA: hypothetical protein VLL05_18465 [Terriglobales bacterium]|nr:hypothetical protein [Terriglobales bacterium]